MTKEPKRNVYVGHRYVPKIMGEWNNEQSYEGLSIVTHQGTSYTSKKHVPVGVDILDEEYWVVTGNYNAQIEHYRQEVRDMQDYVEDELNSVNQELASKANKDDVEDELNSVNQQLAQTPKLVNVKAFGAIGDGVTDDTDAIISAIQSIKTGTVYFPEGVYLVRRFNEDERYSFKVMDKEDFSIVGNNAKIITEPINVSDDYYCFLFKRSKGITIEGLTFDVRLTGNTSVRTNHRILWFQSSDYEESIVSDVTVNNNVFKISHDVGSSSTIALYGVLFSGYNSYIGHNYTVENNKFVDISGRNIQLDQVHDVTIKNNIIERLGLGYVSVGLRVLNGTYNVVVSDNTFRTVDKSPSGSVECIQIQEGNLNKQLKNITVVNNFIECRANDNEVNGIRIMGGKDIIINGNHILQTNETNSDTRATTGIQIRKETNANENISITSNYIRGWLIRQIDVQDDEIDTLFISMNYLGRTIRGVSGLEISANENVKLINNHLAISRGFSTGPANTRTFYYPEKPPVNNELYRKGDIAINTNPTRGGYEKWVYIENEYGNLSWKGVGKIEE